MKTIIKISALLFICILSFSLLLACATEVNAPEDTTPTTSSTPSTTVHTSLNTTPTTSTVPETTTPKTMYYSVTEEERLLIAQLVYREANTESLECQKAIVSVLFNRLACGKWGDTIEEVIEPYLLKLGFLQRTPRGRVLSEQGCKYLGVSKFKNDNQFSFMDDLGF